MRPERTSPLLTAERRNVPSGRTSGPAPRVLSVSQPGRYRNTPAQLRALTVGFTAPAQFRAARHPALRSNRRWSAVVRIKPQRSAAAPSSPQQSRIRNAHHAVQKGNPMSAITQPHRRVGWLAAGVAAVAAAGMLVAALPAEAEPDGAQANGRTVDVQLLSFNDLHGNLEPPAGSSGRVTELQPDGTTKTIDAGGVEYLATLAAQARKGNPYSVTAAGGDMVGASPLISGPLPRRAHHRGAEQARPRRDERRQPRVRRGRQGAGPPAERRLPPHGRLLREGQEVQGRRLPVPRRQRHRREDRQADPQAVLRCGRRRASRSASSA